MNECRDAQRIGISGHIRPDGDCVGAVLSLQMYLRKCLPDAEVKVFLEKPAEIFCGLKGFAEIDSSFPEEEPFDVFFALDCGFERLGDAQKYFRAAKKTINIDHHVTNSGDGMLNVIRSELGSVCELVYELLDTDKLDRELAEALYTGIIHDTGVFQYSNTSPATLEKAAKLISYGFDFPRLIRESYYQKTYVQTQIMGRALMESIRFMNNRCIVSLVDRRTMEFYQVDSKDLDGIVNQLKNIEGISCAVFMYETGVQEYKVSLRSDESVDVARVVSCFGGGGHARAAGCTMRGTFYDCVNNLSLHIAEQLDG